MSSWSNVTKNTRGKPLVARTKATYNWRVPDTPDALPEKPSPPDQTAHGGIEITGGDVRAGRDIVAGDEIIQGDSITGQNVTVQRGYSADQVQRLVLIVGGLVFLTAACFFTFGAISAAALVTVINRPMQAQPQKAEAMAAKIDALNQLQPGQTFTVNFTEEEINSYVNLRLGPALGVNNASARFTGQKGQIALSGNSKDFNNLPFLAVLNVTTGDKPFVLQNAYLKVLPTPQGSSIGYVPVTPLGSVLNQRINALFGNVQITNVSQPGTGVNQPAIDDRGLILSGVAK